LDINAVVLHFILPLIYFALNMIEYCIYKIIKARTHMSTYRS